MPPDKNGGLRLNRGSLIPHLFVLSHKNYASVHLQLPDYMTVDEVDKLTRKLENKVYKETGVILAGVGVYSTNTQNEEIGRIQKNVEDCVLSYKWALQLHGFYVDLESKEMRFDVVMSFDIDPKEGLKILYDVMKEQYPTYIIHIAPDID